LTWKPAATARYLLATWRWSAKRDYESPQLCYRSRGRFGPLFCLAAYFDLVGFGVLRDFLKHWSPRVETPDALRQAGALPYAVVEGQLVFLLITTRKTGRWIFPKGDIEPGMTPWDSAALEALEEAGVTGEISQAPIGSYRASTGGSAATLIDVDLYPLRVTEQLDEWREKGQRLRHWVTLEEGKRLLADRSLAQLAQKFQAQHAALSR
jgi:8-oxo-dGTP pyrophosphatase MutT (NUDIX family)